MSGIAGILEANGKPVERELLQQMAQALSFRGPDFQQIWKDGSVGLAHSAHWVSGDGTRSMQPESLGTGTWITADVRLDAREELVAELRARGRDTRSSNSDSQLLLHAYETWREKCLNHMIGDFSFALWDGRQGRLFCACDQFGVRQFYFFKTDSCFVFSNTLDCVRLHPQVSERLNDAAIGDFLLFGMNYQEDTTSFADIHHLPRAHWLRWSPNGVEIREYWRPPLTGEIRYKRDGEYAEHFDELLTKAVTDRVRANSVGILLSGGVDSSSVAAVCKETAIQGHPREIHAFTVTTEGPGDKDGPAAKRVADALKIPMHCCNISKTSFFEEWGTGGVRWPEPIDNPLASAMLGQFREISSHSPVLLSGEGCDNLMVCKPVEQLRRLWLRGRRAEAALETVKHAVARFSAPDGMRGPLRRLFKPQPPSASQPIFPEWLNPDLVARLNLRSRWSNPFPRIQWNEHPLHPTGYGSLFYPHWRRLFETQDAAYTKAAVEVRYPFLDVRLVNFLLAIPALPWFFRKFLLRDAMRGRLPEVTRKRPKTPAQDVLAAVASRRQELPKTIMASGLDEYVKTDSICALVPERYANTCGSNFRPWCLSFWLSSMPANQPAASGVRAKAGSFSSTDEYFVRRISVLPDNSPKFLQ